jgi:hypothetical protein
VEDLTTYMADKGVSKVKECKELQTKGWNKAFRNGIPVSERKIVSDAAFWPEEVTFRTFRFR